MGQVLFGAVALLAVILGMVNRRAFVLFVVLMAGIPFSLLTGDTKFLAALGGMAGQAVWLFAIVVGCLAALISQMGRLHLVLGRTPAMLLFLLLGAMSLTWAESFLDGLRMLVKLAAPMLFLWVILAMDPDKHLRRRIETALYAGCIIALLIALTNTLSGGFFAPVARKPGLFGMAALTTPFSSPANFSFLILCGALSAYCRFLASRRVIHFVLAAVLFGAVALAFVRISMAGALLGVAIIHLVRARAIMTPIFMGLAALGVFFVVTSDAFMSRMFFVPESVRWQEAVTAPDRFMEKVNTSGRTLLWSNASRAFAEDSPWVGAGVGAVDQWINTRSHTELHSEVFRLWLELGWLGLGIFVSGLAALWWRLLREVRRARRDEVTVPLRASCALLPAYFLTLLTDNTFNYATGFGVIVYAFAAMAIRLSTGREHLAVDFAKAGEAGAR